ncbi:Hypothetical protein SCLAV_p0951 (plasmid) [Streptomyces clavuligerus]|uniref:Uncharacterized protein n=1 Tax=Streptomyces clavuligerus TaxID=1901 RepID=B5GMC9_STRCL|nr:hypothetical protein SSCG_00503 [Streptomyces clavuligerus]EFG04438.1 Hypothetical protein SCLAV_p0951 [Streptomyces clavuligerus]
MSCAKGGVVAGWTAPSFWIAGGVIGRLHRMRSRRMKERTAGHLSGTASKTPAYEQSI